jgi:hypothetical protein
MYDTIYPVYCPVVSCYCYSVRFFDVWWLVGVGVAFLGGVSGVSSLVAGLRRGSIRCCGVLSHCYDFTVYGQNAGPKHVVSKLL